MVKSKKRREVTDKEFEEAWNNSDNRKVVMKVVLSFSKQLTKEEQETCAMHALWRTLGYHREGFGMKFTSNLHKFAKWECIRLLRRNKAYDTKGFEQLPEDNSPVMATNTKTEETKRNISSLYERMELLPRGEKELIRQHYLESRSIEEIGNIHGYTKEAARQKVMKAFARLREICVEGG